MNQVEQKSAAKNFVRRWQAAEGNEDRESRSFWIELAGEVLGIQNPTHVLDFERRIKGRKCDVFFEDQRILVENKGRNVSLDEVRHTEKYGDETPFQQALWYHQHLGSLVKPYWLVTCNFDELRIYDMRDALPSESDYASLRLEELPEKLHLLGFFTDARQSRIYMEKELSVQAAGLVGRIYNELSKQYLHLDSDPREQRSLNVVIVRLVFLLYAEDAGLLHHHQAFLDYMKNFTASQSRQALIDLFRVLDTPYDQRDPYLDPELAAFPYVNGGLFADEDVIIPQLTEQIRVDLLAEASAGFDWSGISPTIFGAAFESTLNPETRRAGGMHYTSIENIHKVIDPLFLDDLKVELASIEGERVQKTREMKLRVFQRKLASIKIFDPAMGSGNFLTESYICLRKLENRVLEDLNGDQQAMGFGTAAQDTIMVNIGQLYGIEINDFAVSVAKTALWIAEAQAMDETQQIVLQVFEFLPLRNISNLVQGNALRMDWSDVCPPAPGVFVCGNPPFKGAHAKPPRLPSQTQELKDAFENAKGIGDADYVSAWFAKTVKYAHDYGIHAGFVATSSITQGQQPALIWDYLFGFNTRINYAYTPFLWGSEASDTAAVAVVVIGFSSGDSRLPVLFHVDYRTGNIVRIEQVPTVNPYLISAPNALIFPRTKPLCNVPLMGIGNKPIDGGFYLFKPDEYEQFVAIEPGAKKYFHQWVGADEFIKGNRRYVLWLGDTPDSELDNLPLCKERVAAVKKYRLSSNSAPTQKLAERPKRFHVENMPSGPSILVPQTSSENRTYLPLGFISPEVFCSNAVRLIPDASLYHFGVLSSLMHNAWMRVVTGRMKSDYQYAANIVYNNFVWPDPTDEQREAVEHCAQDVLDVREAYPSSTLADLYDPEKMPSDLLAAHKALDAAVEAAYGVDFQGDEERIVAHLFKLYAEYTANE